MRILDINRRRIIFDVELGDLGIDYFDILEPTVWINNTYFLQQVGVNNKKTYMLFHVENGTVKYRYLEERGRPGYGFGASLKVKSVADGYPTVTISRLDLGLGGIQNNTLFYGMVLYDTLKTIGGIAVVGNNILVLSHISKNTSAVYYYEYTGEYRYVPAT